MEGKTVCVLQSFSFRWCFLIIILCVVHNSTEIDVFSNIFNKDKEFYYPTIKSNSEKCRNFSRFYLENLNNGVLWANEMFDATAKLQSGILHGSTYNLGNFDQCVEVKIPVGADQEEYSGKYCIVNFKLLVNENPKHNINFEEDDYNNYSNISVKDKMLAYTKLKIRFPRHEIYSAFCIPSVCSREDLEESLKSIILNSYKNNELEIQVVVGERSCQIKDESYKFNFGDIAFLAFISITGIVILFASIYHLLTSIEVLKPYKLHGKKDLIIRCFSFPANLEKLLKTKSKNADGLDNIAGLKVYSMFLIIMGHRCMFTIGSPIVNARFVEQKYIKPETTILLNGPIIVDTFFVISGFLFTFLLLNKLTESKNLFGKLPKIYFHRLMRMLPVYAVVVAFYCTIFVKIGSGPFWNERVGLEQERCTENWWANLLFINNYIHIDRLCMFQSWFIDCDMHFFLLTPLNIWLCWQKPKAAFWTLIGLISVSIVVVFTTVYTNDYDPILLLYMKLLKDPAINFTFQYVYIPSHMRATPYLIGILTGYLRYRIKITGYKIPRYIFYFCWPIFTLLALATIFAAYVFYAPNVQKDALFSACYASMHHFTWSLSIGACIIALTTGNGFMFEKILRWKPLISLSRITYSAFLVHGAIQMYTAATIRTPTYISIFNLLYQAFADIGLSYSIAALLSLFFEAPIIQLENIILGKGHKDKHFNTIINATTEKALECIDVTIIQEPKY